MLTHILGFPRMGRGRELKRALEGYWSGDISGEDLRDSARRLRLAGWSMQRAAGLDLATVGDFSLYDHMLDAAVMLGVAPPRFAAAGPEDLDGYFRMARGDSRVAPLEMTKWFDTNYHYLAPELGPGQAFAPDPGALLAQAAEARAAGFRCKIVLPGPLTFLRLAKSPASGFDCLDLLEPLGEAYAEILRRLGRVCEWVELDEPALVQDLPQDLTPRFRAVYAALIRAARPARLLLAAPFGSLVPNLPLVADLRLGGLHLDLARAPEQLDAVMSVLATDTVLSLGLVDGRNVWRVDAVAALALAERAAKVLGRQQLMLGSSCSLLHCPLDLDLETGLDPELRSWMAFALDKCRELRALADLAHGRDRSDWLEENVRAWASRRASPRTCDPEVRRRAAAVTQDMLRRTLPYAERATAQRRRLKLPLLPATTIGSFPQTDAIRDMRARRRRGEIGEEAYREFLRGCVREAVARQESLGLDVLVHGEPERNDMVEYFGERLRGFCFTRQGWVQSYGSRCVKPPVIYGDVSRPGPLTVEWTRFAQSLTPKPVKGMLTGPVTILCWSFVRDDLPRAETCAQIALALRDEVLDLERAGLGVIQIDEPALREGLPLRRAGWEEYLRWAVDCFRLAANGAAPGTQIHTHMCYCEFNEIVEWIAAMDADVISIEASRSRMELLEAFRRFAYPNEIGPGVYDIHSPRVPAREEMADLLRRAAAVIPAQRLWANPDCGLKTRDWAEAMASLANLVAAARQVRGELGGAAGTGS